jgi:hypothetical protein
MLVRLPVSSTSGTGHWRPAAEWLKTIKGACVFFPLFTGCEFWWKGVAGRLMRKNFARRLRGNPEARLPQFNSEGKLLKQWLNTVAQKFLASSAWCG